MSNSDIALIASIDFRKADEEVNAFVNRSKQKMSTILAAANKPGGSQDGIRNAGTGANSAVDRVKAEREAERAAKRSAAERVKAEREAERAARRSAVEEEKKHRESLRRAKEAAHKRRQLINDYMQAQRQATAMERNFHSGNINWRRKLENGYTNFWRSALGERERLAKEYSKRTRAALQGSRAVKFGSGPNASLIDSMFPSEREIKANSARIRKLFEREMATGTVERRSVQTKAFIDSMFPTDSQINANSARIRAQFEKDMATGTVKRQAGSLGSFIDRQLGLDPASVSKSEQAAKTFRKRIESALTPATGTVLRQSGSLKDFIDRNISAYGTGRQEAIAASFNKQAEAAERAAKRIENANKRIEASEDSKLAREQARSARLVALRSQRASAEEVQITRTTGSASNTALGVQNRIGRQLGDNPALQAELANRLNAALTAYTNTVRAHGTRSKETAEATIRWNRELQNVRSSIAENGGLLRTLNRNSDGLRASIGKLGAGFSSFNRLALNTQVVLTGLTAAFGFREIVDSIVNFERFSNTLRSVSGNTVTFQENMRYLFADAERVGFSVSDVGNSFARLSVAMQGAGFSASDTRTAFTNLTEASRNFGLTSADTMGIVRALEQSMSKGKFMAEEVRLQMGDRLPIAMAALQAAMQEVDGGVVDVNKRFEEGTIDVQRYGLAFVRQLQIMSGGSEALSRTQNSVAAAFGRLSNAFTLFVQELDKAGFSQAVISVTDQLGKIMGMAADSGVLSVFGSVVLTLANNFTLLAGAALAVGAALTAGKILSVFTAIAAVATPLGAALTGVAAALAVVGLAFGKNALAAQDYARAIGQTAVESARATTAVTSQVSDATRALDVGVASSTQNAESNFQRLVRSLQQTGASLEEATRRALESTQKAVDAQIALTRSALQTAQRDLQNYINATTNANRFDTQLDANIRDQSGAYGGPSAAYLEAAGSFRSLIDTLRDGSEPIEVIAGRLRDLQTQVQTSFDAATQANDPLRDQLLSINVLIGTMLESFGKLNAAQLTKLREQIQNVTRDLAAQTGQANILSTTIANLGQPIQGGDGPAGNNAGSATRIRPLNFESVQNQRARNAERNLRNALTQAGAIGPVNQGQATVLGPAPSLAQMREFIRTTPEASAVLQQYNKDLREGGDNAGRLSNSLEELMQDMRRQASSAGLDDGAASAYADALNRVEDAAKNARGGINITAQRAEALGLVTQRLTAEREKSIREMDRTTAGNLAIANAYRQSAAAGAEAEIRVRAQTEALKYGKVGTVEYVEAVNLLTAAFRRSAAAEAAATASRQIADDNAEIEVLRLEQSLLSTNVELREQEVAALRARQQFRDAPADVRDAAEASARQLVAVRQEGQQLQNSWDELSRVGEQAFERIGSAITEAFAQGGIKAVNFGNIAKAVFSEVIQAGLRMAVINPVLNSLFGGSRGTIGGVMSAVSTGGAGASSGGLIGNVFGGLFSGNSGASQSSGGQVRTASLGVRGAAAVSPNVGPAPTGALRQIGGGLFDTGGSIYTPGYSFGSGVVGRFDSFAGTGFARVLDTPIWTSSAAPTNVGAFAEGAMAGTGTTATNSLSLGQAAMGGLSILGGAYGIYSGLQQGGAKGYVNALGGAAGVVGGGAGILSSMGIGGAAMAGAASIAPYVAVAAAIVSAMLPDKKPSNKEQNVSYNTATGLTGTDGQTGSKYSQQNADAARALGDQVLAVGKMIGTATGLGDSFSTNFTVGYGDRDGIYFKDAEGRINRFDREASDAAQKLIEKATESFLKAAEAQATDGGLRQVISNVDKVGTQATLENIQWYKDVYSVMSTTQKESIAFQNSLKAIEDNFDAAAAKARELGLGESGLNEQRKIALDAAVAERDTTVAAMRAELDENLLRAKGIDYLSTLNQMQRESNSSIESLKESLKQLGLTAEESKPHVDVLTESLALQREEAVRELNRQRAAVNFDGDQYYRNALAGYTGNAVDSERAALADFDYRAALEVEELTKTLKALGFNTEATTIRLKRLTDAQDLARKTVQKTYEDQRKAVAQSLSDRMFALTNDSTTEAGALAALERDHSRERVEAAQQGLADLVELEKVQAAERAKVSADFAKQQAESIRQVGGSIRQYLDSLLTSGAAGTSPREQFAAAQSIFARDLTLARGGDMEALNRITQSADTLLQASGDMYASGPQYQAMRDMIIASLESLPSVKSYDQLILEELQKLGGTIQVQTEVNALLHLEADIDAALSLIETSAATELAKVEAESALATLRGNVEKISVSANATSDARAAAYQALSTIAGALASIAVAAGVTDAARTAATARLQNILGAVSSITVATGVTDSAKVAASNALRLISGAVASIAVDTTVTDKAKETANEALDNIAGKVTLITMDSSVPTVVKETASKALGTISGNVASIALATSVTDAVKEAATSRLSKLVGVVSSISLDVSIPEAVRASANKTLSTISGVVASITVSTTVTDKARSDANAALDAIVGSVEKINLSSSTLNAARVAANEAMQNLTASIGAIALASDITDAVREDATTRLSQITAAVTKITMDPSVPEVVQVAANKALSNISGSVKSIAVSPSVTDTTRLIANTALDDIIGKVSSISLSAQVTAAAREDAVTALSTISGKVSSITLATGVTESVKAAAITGLSTITGVVSSITLSEEVASAVRQDAIEALSSISGNVSSIAMAASVTDAVKAAAISKLSTITGVVSSITLSASVTDAVKSSAAKALSSIGGVLSNITLAEGVGAATLTAANAALSSIVGLVEKINISQTAYTDAKIAANAAMTGLTASVGAITVASGVTDAAKAAAITRLSEITAKVSSITLDSTLVEDVVVAANETLSKMGGVVQSITLNRTLAVEARDKANAVFATMYGVVDKILTPGDRTAAAKANLMAVLGNMTTTLNTVVNSTLAEDTKLQLLNDFGVIQSTLAVAADISGIPENQLSVLFSSAEGVVRQLKLQATGGGLTADQKAVLEAEAGRFDREIKAILSGATSLTSDQRAILMAASGTVERTLKQQVETTETVQISRSIDEKLGSILNDIKYATQDQLSYLHNLGDVRTFLFHIRELSRGQQGGLRVTTLNASGGANGAFQNAGGSPINWARMDNFGGLESGGWVGNGVWNKDSVLASYAGGGHIALAGGEYVINAESAARYADEITSINAGTYWAGGDADQPALIAEVRALREELSALREEAERTADATERTAETNEKMAKDTNNNRPAAVRAGTRRS